MKKLYTLLSLLLLCVAGAQAQITAVSEITADGVYTIAAVDNSRGFLAYNAADGTHLWSTGKGGEYADEAKQWRIIPTATEGNYYIRNVASGTYITGASNPWTLTSTPTVFTIAGGTSSGFTIASTGGNLINISNGYDYGTNCSWNTQDNGNNFQITKVSDATETFSYLTIFQGLYGTSYGSDATIDGGLFKPSTESVASVQKTYADICTQYESTTMSLSDLTTQCTAMDQAIAALAVNYPTTGYYRIKSNGARDNSVNYIAVGANSYGRGDATYGYGLKTIAGAGIASDPSTIIQLVETSETGVYKINAQGRGLYRPTADNQPYLLTSEAGEGDDFLFKVQDAATGRVAIQDYTQGGSGNFLHEGNWGVGTSAVVQWTETAGASQWFVEAVSADDALALTLNACTDGSYYATLNLPFGATIQGAKAYTAAYNADGSAISLTELADGVVAANTPVVLVGSSESAMATVNADAAPSNVASILTGTNFAITSWDASNLALGQVDGKAGFYKWSGSSLSANKAYLVPSTESAGLAFSLGGTSTAIQSAISEAANASNAAIFDLSGRKVQKATKGFYIIGGKKVIK